MATVATLRTTGEQVELIYHNLQSGDRSEKDTVYYRTADGKEHKANLNVYWDFNIPTPGNIQAEAQAKYLNTVEKLMDSLYSHTEENLKNTLLSKLYIHYIKQDGDFQNAFNKATEATTFFMTQLENS